jgi:hypothetical protein
VLPRWKEDPGRDWFTINVSVEGGVEVWVTPAKFVVCGEGLGLDLSVVLIRDD